MTTDVEEAGGRQGRKKVWRERGGRSREEGGGRRDGRAATSTDGRRRTQKTAANSSSVTRTYEKKPKFVWVLLLELGWVHGSIRCSGMSWVDNAFFAGKDPTSPMELADLFFTYYQLIGDNRSSQAAARC